jgi:hypothetical protein
MKRIQQSLLGVSAFLSVPATIEEFNTLAKGEKVLDYANAEAYYRGVAPKVRSLFLELVEKELGIEQKVISEDTVGEGDAAKAVKTYEKDTAFLKRVKASGITDDQLQPLLQRAFDEIGWDLTSSRSTGANKADLEAADFYINAVASGESTWDRIIGKFESANPGLSIARETDGSVTREVMGEACKVNRLRVLNEKMI